MERRFRSLTAAETFLSPFVYEISLNLFQDGKEMFALWCPTFNSWTIPCFVKWSSVSLYEIEKMWSFSTFLKNFIEEFAKLWHASLATSFIVSWKLREEGERVRAWVPTRSHQIPKFSKHLSHSSFKINFYWHVPGQFGNLFFGNLRIKSFQFWVFRVLRFHIRLVIIRR